MSRKFNFMNSVSLRKPKRNTFDLGFSWKGDVKFGALIPVSIQDVVPGDTWKMQDEVMLRFDALIAPILHNVDIYIHYFFVPNRLLWDKWEEFITGGVDGTKAPVKPAVVPTYQQITDTYKPLFGVHSLWDYMQCEPITGTDWNGWDEDTLSSLPPVDLLPFRAYNKIWNDYYRDQNFQDEIPLDTEKSGVMYDMGDFDDFEGMFTLKYRAWEKDYFTSALPWTQRGVQMSIPFSSDIPVSGSAYLSAYDEQEPGLALPGAIAPAHSTDDIYFSGVYDPLVGFAVNRTASSGSTPERELGVSNVGINSDDGLDSNNKLSWVNSQGDSDSGWYLSQLDPGGDDANPLSAHVTSAIAPTINDLRAALRIQEWLERNAVGGSRYIEQIYAHFGVKSSDARLQRAEYLGGGKLPVVISEIQQTSQTAGQLTPLGDLAGHGLGVGSSMKFKKFFEEHGWIIGIMSVMPRSSYSQGIPRKYLRRDKFDYFWPNFAHLGEQPIYKGELMIGPDARNWEETFGYTPRYSEYKYSPNIVVGSLRSSKSFWHLARQFSSVPELNEDFISTETEANNNLNRIFAVTNDWPLTVLIVHKIWAKRPMPRYGTPLL